MIIQFAAAGKIGAGTLAALVVALTFASGAARGEDDGPPPERVAFMSADGRTRLVGYLYRPTTMAAARVPAVVMKHGRAGAYSERANGIYDASTLSLRHKAWGRQWAQAGYIAILVDGFGPRGYPQGFPRFSYSTRPAELNEVTVRPLDAYGALAYLRTREDVIGDRVGLQGWSNGASTAISAIAVDAPGITSPSPETGFRAALVFYPGCGLKGHFDDRPFLPYAPTLVFHGTADEEVSYSQCVALIERSRNSGGNAEIRLYRGTTHSFDSPSRKRQELDANSEATADAIARSLTFFARYVRP